MNNTATVTEMKKEQQADEKTKLTISFTTDWECPKGDPYRYAEMRAEKISNYVHSICFLIEQACEPYVEIPTGKVNADVAQEVILEIKEAAELAKLLARNQI